ncbi:MAG: tetratricopeptide repeat protein [Nitrospiraceae bacterium]|nr:MAG: tetratricopeptide repeat protein [Nitrospiraceae bacterium]
MERYKKWIIVVIAALTGGIVAVSFMTGKSSRQEPAQVQPEERSPVPPGPLLDSAPPRVTPLEELDVDRSDPRALAHLGDQYFEGGNYEQAIAIYRKVLELDPADADTFNDLGLAYYYAGKPDLAVETLEQGAQMAPAFQRIWLSLGFVRMNAGSREDAKSALSKAAELDPNTDVGQEAKRLLGLLG